MVIDVPAFIDSRKIGPFQILVASLCAMVVLLAGVQLDDEDSGGL